jgi:hypothetical protein
MAIHSGKIQTAERVHFWKVALQNVTLPQGQLFRAALIVQK